MLERRRDRLARLDRPRLGALRPPPPGGAAGHRRRADAARRAAGPRRHLQLQRLRARGAGRAGRRASPPTPATVPDTRRGHARRDRARRWRTPTCVVHLRRRLGRTARPRQGPARARSASRSASGAWRCSRASRPGSASATTCSSSACPATPSRRMVTFALFVRPALAALQGADPAATRTQATLTEARPAPRRSATRPCACASSSAPTAGARPRPDRRARTSSARCCARTRSR